jgi:hypothetical protein
VTVSFEWMSFSIIGCASTTNLTLIPIPKAVAILPIVPTILAKFWSRGIGSVNFYMAYFYNLK